MSNHEPQMLAAEKVVAAFKRLEKTAAKISDRLKAPGSVKLETDRKPRATFRPKPLSLMIHRAIIQRRGRL